jgi:hypothetical protein
VAGATPLNRRRLAFRAENGLEMGDRNRSYNNFGTTLCTTEELFQRMDEDKRCSACDRKGNLYYATYVGPLYCAAKHKVLFIGLDHGKETRNVMLICGSARKK